MPVPGPFAAFIGTKLECRSEFTYVFAVTAFMALYAFSFMGVFISIIGVVAVTLEGGYKHFADNLKVLSANNKQYHDLIRQQVARLKPSANPNPNQKY